MLGFGIGRRCSNYSPKRIESLCLGGLICHALAWRKEVMIKVVCLLPYNQMMGSLVGLFPIRFRWR